MNINKKYYDYIIDDKNKHFHIVESLTKPIKNNYLIETLTKIEHILKNNLTYDSSIQDNFSNYNKEMLYNILKNNAIQIQSKFKEKESKKFLIIKNEAKVNSLVNNIENFVELSELFPLHPDATNEIINHLDIYDVGRLAQVNRRGKKFANPIIVDKAKELGFKGDNFTASNYITNLIKDFRKLLGNNKFLIKYFENKKIFEALLHLSNILPNLELFKLLSIQDLYIKYPNIYPFLLKCTDECLEKFSLDKKKLIRIMICENGTGKDPNHQ